MDYDDWTPVNSVSHKKKKPTIQRKVVSINDNLPLKDTWVLWYHPIDLDKWTIDTYQIVMEISNVNDFWITFRQISNINSGMYYLMRKGYPPLWDDPINIGGGGWTFKVGKEDTKNFWMSLACLCIGEQVPPNVVGVSTSPKLRFSTIRVWSSNQSNDSQQFKKIYEQTEHDKSVINFREARFTLNKDAQK